MAGNVTGLIGADNVSLNNAATESTLAALLKIAQIDSKNLLDIAKKTFPDIELKNFEEEILAGTEAQRQETVATVQNTQAIQKEYERHNRNSYIIAQLNESMTKLVDGTAQVSDVFSAFRNAGPIISTLAAGFEKLANIQQQNFDGYQKLTDVGVGFGGSLNDLRQGALSTYLTLDQFQNVVRKNSQLLSMLGGTADQGSKNFVALSSSLIKSNAGAHLMDLGYTTEQVNEGLASYLTMSGGRTQKELQNTNKITEASAEYMEQLDGLARITGESREEQQKALKEASANAMFQAKLQGMSEDERKKALLGMANALATGGKGAVDSFQARILGIPAMSKEAQIFQTTMGNASQAITQSAINVTDSTKTTADMNENLFQAANGIQQDMGKFNDAQKAALIASGGELGKMIQIGQTSANKFAQQTDEDRRKAMERQKLENTQAQQMEKAMSGLKDLGAALWNAFSPLITAVTYLFGFIGLLTKGFAKIIDSLGLVSNLLAGYAVYKAAAWTWEAKTFALEQAKKATGGVMDAVGSVLGRNKNSGPLDALGKEGGGIGGTLTGISTGLGSFGLGALKGGAVLSAVIVMLGAAFAAASWLMGKALPTLAEGLGKIADINGGNLLSVSLGIGALGLSLMTFGPFALFAMPAGLGLSLLADGASKLASIDVDKLDRVANALQKVKDATPTAGDIIKIGIAAMVSKVVGPSETAATTTEKTVETRSDNGNNVASEMKRLNTMTEEMLKAMKENVDYTKRTLSAVKGLSGNGYKF
jgi:hypothetical protein